MAIQGLVNVEMENYDHFLKMTFPYNKYHANIHYLIREISHGLRFKSFPSSWILCSFKVYLRSCCFWKHADDYGPEIAALLFVRERQGVEFIWYSNI